MTNKSITMGFLICLFGIPLILGGCAQPSDAPTVSSIVEDVTQSNSVDTGKSKTYEFMVPRDDWYLITLESTSGDADLVLDKRLPDGSTEPAATSKLRDTLESVKVQGLSGEVFVVRVVGYNDANFRLNIHGVTDEETAALAKASGCFACHSVNKNVVGPAWQDVAARYKDDPNARAFLIQKIKSGGKGNWTEVTQGVPMPPYSPRVRDNDIEQLVDFILALPPGDGGTPPEQTKPPQGPIVLAPDAVALQADLKAGETQIYTVAVRSTGSYTIDLAVNSGDAAFDVYQVASNRSLIGQSQPGGSGQTFSIQAAANSVYEIEVSAAVDGTYGISAAFEPAPLATATVPDLARTSGCLGCHSVNQYIVGPAWIDVAERYRGDSNARTALIEKVRTGGSGNWTVVTRGLAMPANYPRVSDVDIASLVDFILSLERAPQ